MQTENTYVETDLGNIAFNPRGEYSDETSYEYLDTVSYKGGSYVCLAELAKTTSGIAPEPGKNTEHWQMLTLPGGLTSDYIAMHDDVVNKAKQVKTSRTAVELSQQEVEAAQTDVSQMQQDTQDASQMAIASRDSAAGYAQSAEISRMAAKESEDNVKALATTFDSHVNEKIPEAEKEINNTKQNAVDAVSESLNAAVTKIENETNKQVKSVENAGASQVSAVNKAGKSRVDEISTAGSTVIGAVNTTGSKQVSTIETKGADQVKAIQEAGENALQNISNGVDKGLSEEGKAADAKATGEAISKLTEDLSNKITKFYASNQGETHITDSDNGKIRDMMIYGKSSQDGTPTPENPVEIKSVVNPTVKVTNEDGLKVQSVTLNNIILNAIPVSSGGNVTIDGQQYIADYVDVERGKLVKRVYEYVFSGKERWTVATDGAQYLAWRVGDNPGIIDSTYDKKCLCSCLIANIMSTTRKGENYISTQSFDNTCRVWVSANVATSKLTGEKVFLALIVPEEISLTQEEIRAFKELASYYPVINVNVASEQLNGYTVFNYPVSMKNGWNYVKQQLNDNRDYIYDMDLQSTEAYVNSEYAVALTELEV